MDLLIVSFCQIQVLFNAQTVDHLSNISFPVVIITYVVSTAKALLTEHLISSDINRRIRRILDNPLKLKPVKKTFNVVLHELQFGDFVVNLEKTSNFFHCFQIYNL